MPTVLDSEHHSLKRVAESLGVHITTVWRWTLHGVRGRRLHSFLIGGRRYVRTRDLETFLCRSNEDHVAPPDANRRSDIAADTPADRGVRRR